MVGVVQHLADAGDAPGLAPVNLQPDLDAPAVAVGAAFPQRQSDLFQGLLLRDPFGESVGAHLDAGGAHVVSQPDEGLGLLDVAAQDLRIGRVILAGTAEADQADG